MAKEKTTGKVIQKSDQWVETGVTTDVVRGLLTISWRVYTYRREDTFWSAWPGILWVAVVFVGLILVMVGVALRDDGDGLGLVDSNGDSNSSGQRQTAATGDSAHRLHDP